MPQHSVGRSLAHWVVAVNLAIALTGGYVQPDQTALASGDGSARLSLPWRQGEFWRLTGGPHPETGGKTRPWSALDFQPRSGESRAVRAARGGRVSRPCANMVIVDHGDGWATSYYHVKKIRVKNGQMVDRGQVLGLVSKRSGCGGYATGPHVHFSLMWKGQYVNIRGAALGGWTVKEGSQPYAGCLVKDGVWRCAPSQSIYNYGLVGAQ
jgi:LasA protease